MRRRIGGIGGLSFLWSVVILQVGTWFAMFTAEPGWLGSWRQAVDNGVGTVEISGSLLAGLVAGTYASLRRTAFVDLVVASARPVRGWFGPAIRLWVASCVSLATVLAAVTVRASFYDVPMTPRQFVTVPVGVLMLGVHALIGMVIGLRAGPRVAAVLAACTSFGLFLLTTNHLAPPSFATGGLTGSLYGEQYRIASVVALCSFAVASAATLVPWVGWSVRAPRIRWTATATAVAVIVGLAHQTWPDLESRMEAGTVSYRCGGTTLQICVVTDRPSRDLEDIARRLTALAEPLRRIGIQIPTRWKHSLYGHPADSAAGDLMMDSDAEVGGRVSDADLVRSLVEPADCPQYPDGNEPPLVYVNRFRIATWLVVRNQLDHRGVPPRWFMSRESDGWVRTTYEQLRRCDLDAVRKP